MYGAYRVEARFKLISAPSFSRGKTIDMSVLVTSAGESAIFGTFGIIGSVLSLWLPNVL